LAQAAIQGDAGAAATLGVHPAVLGGAGDVRVSQLDFLGPFYDGELDVIYSSHTLEHCWEVGNVVDAFRVVLGPKGRLFVVLPFPDCSPKAELVHGARGELGTDVKDGGVGVARFFTERGFCLDKVEFDSFREPEIWRSLRKKV